MPTTSQSPEGTEFFKSNILSRQWTGWHWNEFYRARLYLYYISTFDDEVNLFEFVDLQNGSLRPTGATINKPLLFTLRVMKVEGKDKYLQVQHCKYNDALSATLTREVRCHGQPLFALRTHVTKMIKDSPNLYLLHRFMLCWFSNLLQ